jgi:hypothetical protein
MRNQLAVVVIVIALAAACGKSASSTLPFPTSPSAVAPPASPAPAPAPPAPEPIPTPAPPAPQPVPLPQPSTNPPVFSTLNAPNTIVGGGVDIVAAERAYPTDRQVYDDFVIPGGATIRTISWQGHRFLSASPSRIFVAFMADAGGRGPVPGASDGHSPNLWSAMYAFAEVNERLERTQACANAPQQQCGYFDYSVGMRTPFIAAAGTRYWLMIQADNDPQKLTGFYWRKGTRDNGFSTGNLADTTFPWDMAFALRP